MLRNISAKLVKSELGKGEVKPCFEQRHFDVKKKPLRWQPPVIVLCSRRYFFNLSKVNSQRKHLIQCFEQSRNAKDTYWKYELKLSFLSFMNKNTIAKTQKTTIQYNHIPIYSFNRHIFIAHLLHARFCFKHWGFSGMQNKKFSAFMVLIYQWSRNGIWTIAWTSKFNTLKRMDILMILIMISSWIY